MKKKKILKKSFILFSFFVSFFIVSQTLIAQTSFTTIGDASSSGGGCYVLTPNSDWQQGTAWCNIPLNLSQPLNIQYNLNFGNQNSGADGIAFILQNQGTAVIGASGQGMGYSGISPSVIVEFDEYQNSSLGDPSNDHVAVTLNGEPDHGASINSGAPLVSFPANIEDGNWHSVQITWDPVLFKMEVYFDCQLVITYTNNIINNIFSSNPNVWWGFTSATGGSSNLHQFCYAPPIQLTFNPTVACFGQCNGSAAITNTTGGTGPYSYLWDNGQTTPSISNLCSGTYTVLVTSALGCFSTDTITITESSTLTANITNPIQISCFGGNNGSATANGSGGTGAMTYSWNSAPIQTTATASNLTAGNYVVTITDANMCTATQSLIITEPPAITVTPAQTNITCFGNNDASASVSATGGISPYSYAWNTSPTQTTSSASGISAGNYTCIVSDASGCTLTTSFTISEPPVLMGSITNSVNVSCFGGNNGSATANGMGGTGTITYSWNTSPVQISAAVNNLISGNYVVIITDANNCTITQSITITEPPALILTTSTTSAQCGINNGTATASSLGGVMPYSYLWLTTPVQTTVIISGLGAGIFNVLVVDANGCTQSQSAVVGGGIPLTADFSFDPITVSLLDPLVNFTDLSSGNPYSWTWDFDDTSSVNDSSNYQYPTHTYSDSGLHCVKLMISDSSGFCRDTSIKCFKIEAPLTFYAPNSFTPNGDGHNELFMGYGTYIKDFHMLIFDRWGNILFESNDINKGWDGQVNNRGEIAQEDVYMWKVALKDSYEFERFFIGRVTVIR